MSYKNLKDEILNDPKGAGYSTMTGVFMGGIRANLKPR